MAQNPFAVPIVATKQPKTAFKNPFGIKETTPVHSKDTSALFEPNNDPWGQLDDIDVSDSFNSLSTKNQQQQQQQQSKQPAKQPPFNSNNQAKQQQQQQQQRQPPQNSHFQQNNGGFSNPFGGSSSNNGSNTLDMNFSMDTGASSTSPFDNNNQQQLQQQQQYQQQNPRGNNQQFAQQYNMQQNSIFGPRESIQQTNQRNLQFDPNNVDPDNEPPLLVELGIDLNSIKVRTISVLKFQKCDIQFLEDPDMSGPIIIGFIFGFLLLLSGKLHFGYIYGFGISGTIAIYCIMNFLSMHKQIPLYNTMSILGYCLLPMILLAFLNVFLDLKGLTGIISGVLTILWATIAATNFFVELLSQSHQKFLVAYPIFLLYSIFALITVF